jgi:hypothetical protein
MGDRRVELHYSKAQPPSVWQIAPRAALAAVLFAFPLLDYFANKNLIETIKILDLLFLFGGVLLVIQIVFLYRKR